MIDPRHDLAATPAQMKKLEQESDTAGVSYEALMENAGRILAVHISGCRYSKAGVIFLCGSGNNAGDCFVAARYLKESNISSSIFLLCGEPKSELAVLNFGRLEDIPVIRDEQEMIEILKSSAGSALIADGVFGTGFHGELPENIKRIFDHCGTVNIAVDVPSGGNCSTGAAAEGTPRADITVTFGCCKFGMTQYPLRSLCGDIITADIGIPENVYQNMDYPVTVLNTGAVENMIPKRKPDAHKGDFGRLLNVCGSLNMPGAALMSAEAAARSGIGLLTVCVPASYVPNFAARLPEAVYLPLETSSSYTYTENSYDTIIKAAEKMSAVLIGCGIGISDDSRRLVKGLLENINCPIILDADGINCIADCIDIIRQPKQKLILTPHPAEMARLLGISVNEVQSDRLECAKSFAQKYGCTVILKGAGTVIAYPDRAYVCPAGNPGMSKGGSGDVLSGIVAAFTAQKIPPEAGVYVHAWAGDRAAEKYSMQSMLPGDIIKELGGFFKNCEEK